VHDVRIVITSLAPRSSTGASARILTDEPHATRIRMTS
jgi:hypothetical protein